ncbi:hypothetical protein CBM2615_A120159 [Cupriavidus taiwanensis]|uniref:Uncharacterized protein n=1 Tax=Cupriavidus taiwanensis TaxID=164546 RepID=A0A976AT15_9BURK|nr:hypothetical protein CBM2615_A120159 [Cupriavidus taiwanensis]SOZ52003.1 hypothetical protein CBM2613_A110158 [Cupriavidus taiwanensis]SPA07167.1 hypothetical protein CBM2625_A90156 [Cupriavidus taiwanensis]
MGAAIQGVASAEPGTAQDNAVGRTRFGHAQAGPGFGMPAPVRAAFAAPDAVRVFVGSIDSNGRRVPRARARLGFRVLGRPGPATTAIEVAGQPAQFAVDSRSRLRSRSGHAHEARHAAGTFHRGPHPRAEVFDNAVELGSRAGIKQSVGLALSLLRPSFELGEPANPCMPLP